MNWPVLGGVELAIVQLRDDHCPHQHLLESLQLGTTRASMYIFVKLFYRKIDDFSRIRTVIVGVEGKHATHLTNNNALS